MNGYEKYINIDDAQIHIEVYGQGEPIIFLHGNGGSIRSFDKQIPVFMQEYMIVCIDTRGHGKSTLGSKKLDFTLISSDVIKVMDDLKIAKANIIGFSDGGNTALTLAINYPNRINSIIVSGANLYPQGVVDYIKIPMYLGYRSMQILSIFGEKFKTKRELFSLIVNHPHIDPNDLSKIKVPAFIMAGDRDLIKREHTDLITKKIKKSVQYIVKDCDHFIADEKPDEFNYIVMDFITNIVYKR